MEETINKYINDNPDSLDIGTAGKGGNIKVYGNFLNSEEFKAKILKAIEVRKFAQDLIKEE
jgi:hypothetical protein